MTNTLKTGLAMLVYAALVVGCNSSYSKGDVTNTGYLTDSTGRTVYTFDKDSAGSGTSACYDDCLAKWPVVSPSFMTQAGIGKLVRTDGTPQATLDGKPLYYFVGDKTPGERNGDGVRGVWHTVTAMQTTSKSSGMSY